MLNVFLQNVKQKYNVAANDDIAVKPYTKPGKLDTKEDWRLNGIEYLEDAFGSPEYDRCGHCGKTIRYVVNLTTPDLMPEAKVGPDCALTLLKNPEDVQAVQDFVGNYQKKYKFIDNITAYLKKESSIADEQDDFLKYLDKAQRHIQFKHMMKFDTITYKSLALSKSQAKRLASFAETKNAEKIFKIFSTRKLLNAVLAKNPAALKTCLEKCFLELKLTARDKKYFFDAKEAFGPISEFLADNEEILLDHTIGSEELTGRTWLTAPDA